jgi:CubicO group peptidase (beta-lactamase class C family)
MGNQNRKIWGADADSYYGLAFSVTTKLGQDKGGAGNEGTFSWGGYFNTSYFANQIEGITGVLMKQTQETTDDDTEWKFSILVSQAVDD